MCVDCFFSGTWGFFMGGNVIAAVIGGMIGSAS